MSDTTADRLVQDPADRSGAAAPDTTDLHAELRSRLPRLRRLPGVYTPQGDTGLLMAHLGRETLPPGARSLDLCTGTGALAVAAALRGARATAVDVSRRAVANARLNALLHGCRVRVLRGDLDAPVADELFDLVTVNPPYVPSEDDELPARGARRSWDAGTDGRLLLDRVCARAPRLLAPSGVLLVVQSSLSGVDATLDGLHRAGLRARVLDRRAQPYGPVMAARAGWFAARGLVEPGTRTEELVVIRASRPGWEAEGPGRRRTAGPTD